MMIDATKVVAITRKAKEEPHTRRGMVKKPFDLSRPLVIVDPISDAADSDDNFRMLGISLDLGA